MSMLPGFAVLCAILAVIFLGGRAARHFGLVRKPEGTRLSVVESLSLDARRRLVLVKCDERHVLILAGQTDQVVSWLPATPP